MKKTTSTPTILDELNPNRGKESYNRPAAGKHILHNIATHNGIRLYNLPAEMKMHNVSPNINVKRI